MSKAVQSSEESRQSERRSSDFSRDEMLEVLSNQRRRFAMHYLKQRDGDRIGVSELADHVASWENDKEIEQLSHQERKRVRNALRQFHLPKMDDNGFVEYDSQRGTVALTERASRTNFYVDSLTGGDVPWGVYYLGLSVLSVVCLTGVTASVPPFNLASPLTYGVFFVMALSASAVGHCYDNYCRMRLGARDRPPELDRE